MLTKWTWKLISSQSWARTEGFSVQEWFTRLFPGQFVSPLFSLSTYLACYGIQLIRTITECSPTQLRVVMVGADGRNGCLLVRIKIKFLGKTQGMLVGDPGSRHVNIIIDSCPTFTTIWATRVTLGILMRKY